MARAAVKRAGDPTDLRVMLLIHDADLTARAGDPAGGAAMLDEARRLLDDAGAADPTSPLHDALSAVVQGHAEVRRRQGDLDGAIAAQREAAALRAARYGELHIDQARVRADISTLLAEAGRFEEAIAELRESARITEATLGESVMLVLVVNQIGAYSLYLGRSAEGLAAIERAVGIARRVMPADDPRLVQILGDLAAGYGQVGRNDEALATFAEAIALSERGGHAMIATAGVHSNRGSLHRDRGDCAAALPDLERALAIYAEYGMAETPESLFPLYGIAECHAVANRHDETVAAADRILALPALPYGQELIAATRWLRGRALVASQRDVRGGRAEVAAARDQLLAMGQADRVKHLERLLR
jgi:tetratricopeptide (TPR) repeat protein